MDNIINNNLLNLKCMNINLEKIIKTKQKFDKN